MSNDEINLPKSKCDSCKQMLVKEFKFYHKASYKKVDEKSGTERKLEKRRKKYVDDTGRLWHGKVCPDCSMNKRLARNTAKSEAVKEELKKILEE